MSKFDLSPEVLMLCSAQFLPKHQPLSDADYSAAVAKTLRLATEVAKVLERETQG